MGTLWASPRLKCMPSPIRLAIGHTYLLTGIRQRKKTAQPRGRVRNCIHFLITEHLSSCHPISESQWGFQVGKSTVSALLATTHDWLQHLEAGQDVCAVFFDLKKAFDSVPHRSLLDKLKLLNLHLVLIRWICSYLMGRAQSVVIDGELSEPIHVLSGVPQGSVLGPLLFFNIY